MIEGRIVKGIGGFYYVDSPQGLYQCRARGLFKKQGIQPTVGDLVRMEPTEEEVVEGYVVEILPRRNLFVRPPIANVDLLAVVVALAHPAPSMGLLDRLLVTGERASAEILLVFNKTDLAPAGLREEMAAIYGPLYETLFLSAKTGEGMPDFCRRLAGSRAALMGASGVGKSTLLNHLCPGREAATGQVSEKTKRGRHTTRHVEIFPMDEGGWVFDTPGFSSFEVEDLEEGELADCFPEMRPFLGQCRFQDCRHHREPDCRIREAVEEGKIREERYASYLAQLEEVRKRRSY